MSEIRFELKGERRMDILTDIAQKALLRVQSAKMRVSPEDMMKQASLMIPRRKAQGFPFEKALSGAGIGLIAECKKASPSKGVIDPVYKYLEIALEYERHGADCISVLTEPEWFLGSDTHLEEIAGAVKIPCLRKDFVVDDYMIYEAAALGASAVLIICSLCSFAGEKSPERFIGIAHDLGLSALVEVHDRDEVQTALDSGARMIGVNNRNLRDFSVDISNSMRLREHVPEGVIFVAESGIKGPEDVAGLRDAGVDAILIGEALMVNRDGGILLRAVRQACKGEGL